MIRPPRQRWLLVLVAILLLTNIATLSIYWIKKPSHDGGPGHDTGNREKRMGQFLVDQMKFDANQAATYWKLRDSMIASQRPVVDSMRNAKKNFFDLLNQPGATDSALIARSNEIAALQKKLDLATFRHFQNVRAICRPDQLEKFDTVIKEIVNRMTPFRRMGKQDSTDKRNAER
jgi:Spy/CpxP family protein refolding chaperone